ncbi:MAG TPA: alpha/beta fold hydrolase [Thermomicrobiales bacterium]|nr:alpha/beta fold hydrolase [Thermomicrobiales bacterium]
MIGARQDLEVDRCTGADGETRFSRRQIIGTTAAGLTAAGLTAGPRSQAAAQISTPASTPVPDEQVGLSGLAFENPEFDAQFLRALDTVIEGGADIGECFITARRIVPDDHDSWLAEWRATADRIFGYAEASLAAGHPISAREAYLRSMTYYRTSGVFLYRPPLDPALIDSFDRQRDAFRRYAELSEYVVEEVAIPYEETTLPAYFLTPPGSGPYPTLVMVDGYEGTKEELFLTGGAAALKRGYATLLIDGPGQGGVLFEQGMVFRPDWEAVVTPQVDWLLTRPEVDPARIALMGRSWGGYLAPRAATGEHRIAAVIADAAQYAPGERAATLLPPEYRDQLGTATRDELNQVLLDVMAQTPFVDFAINRGLLTHGFERPIDFLLAYEPYTIRGLADRITCPTLICEAENDVRGGDAQPLYDAIVAPKEYMLFTNAEGAGEHDELGAASRFQQRVFDWLDETLAIVP